MPLDLASLIKKVKHIHIQTDKKVQDILCGAYHSAFKGNGIEFEDVAPYQVGCDHRSIDWNVTAKYGSPYVKKFSEERQLSIMLVLDISASTHYGSSEYTKREHLTYIAALLALSASKNGDKIGLLLFSDGPNHYLPPKRGHDHCLRLLRDCLYYESSGSTTNLGKSLTFLNRNINKQGVCFILSDFLYEIPKQEILFTTKKHDLTAICMRDKQEQLISNTGINVFQDLETGESFSLDTSDPQINSNLKIYHSQQLNLWKEIFQKYRAAWLEFSNQESVSKKLKQFFHSRKQS